MLAFARGGTITLSTISRADTGHLVFHSNAGGFLACASCHAEGNDDGRVWNFTCQGPRRTQSLHAAGLRGTEPFHWDGEETDIDAPDDRRVRRPHVGAGAGERSDQRPDDLDRRPAAGAPRARPATRPPSSAAARCSTIRRAPPAPSATRAPCSRTTPPSTSAPAGAFQVPSLVGIGTRGPFMHDGCAKTLADRFSNETCGGGDRHGNVRDLTSSELADLVAFLQSI